MDGQTDASSPAVFFLIHLNDGGKYSPSVRARQSLQFKSSLCLSPNFLSHHSNIGRSKSTLGRFPYQPEQVKQPSCCLIRKGRKTVKLHHRGPGSAFSYHMQHNWLWLSLLSDRGCLHDCLTIPKGIALAVPRGHQPLEHRQDCRNMQQEKGSCCLTLVW